MDMPARRPHVGLCPRRPLPLVVSLLVSVLVLALVAGACSGSDDDLVASTGDLDLDVAADSPAEDEPAEDPPDAATDQTTAPAPAANLTRGCVADGDYSPEVDYFPAKTDVRHAERLAIRYEPNYKVVTVSDANFEGASFTYVLVQCGTPDPPLEGDLASATVIEVPVSSMAVMSTTILPGLDGIDRLDVLAALDSFDFVQNERVRELIDAGELVRTGTLSFELDIETLVDLGPDVILANLFGPAAEELGPLDAVGLVGVVDADYRETTPLGRSEWMKLAAVLLNEESAVNELFDMVEQDYQTTAALVADVETRPQVLTDGFNEFNGAWFVPGSESFAARFIVDAGGDYVFADQPGNESIPFDLEAVLAAAGDADVWLNPGFSFYEKDDLVAADPRHGSFAAFQDDAVWNYRLEESGASDYFELGAARPDLVLADLVSILHPDLLPDHDLVFYVQLS